MMQAAGGGRSVLSTPPRSSAFAAVVDCRPRDLLDSVDGRAQAAEPGDALHPPREHHDDHREDEDRETPLSMRADG